MADPVSVGSLNPFGNVNLGGSMGTFGAIALVVVIAIVIIGLVGFLIYWKSVKKSFWINIHVFRLIGNIPTRVAIYSAKEIPFGMAGDKLWKVAPSGFNKWKTIKWLPVGKIQTAPREFWYYIREDGEWINFSLTDLNAVSKEAGVRFVQEDMRLQRLATERLLEQRLMNKTFWEKWGTTIMMIIVFLVIAICMVIIFFQFGKVIDKFGAIAQTQADTSKILLRVFGENYINNALNQTAGGTQGLIPA
jgi:hypothetical protein